MHPKTLTFLLFSTLAIAAPADEDAAPTSVTVTVPSDIVSEFYSALPTSDRAKITDLAGAEEVLSEYASSTAWWSTLPADVKSFATSVAILGSSLSANAASVSSTINSSAASTITSTSTTTTSTNGSNSDSSSASASDSASVSNSAGASSSSSPSTESSTAGVPAATDNIALGFAGVAGVLGVALAL